MHLELQITWYKSISVSLQVSVYLSRYLSNHQSPDYAHESSVFRYITKTLGQKDRCDFNVCLLAFHYVLRGKIICLMTASEEEMAAYYSILSQRILWTEEPGGVPAVYGVSQSWKQLKRFSSSSSNDSMLESFPYSCDTVEIFFF